MDFKTRMRRIAILIPVAIALFIYNVRTDGWASTKIPLTIFVVGVLILVPLFKLLGLFP
jgi:hypothetical protein